MQEQQIKHRFAENYRGLYNEYIDSLVDKVNVKYSDLIKFDKMLNEDNIDDLRKYKKLYDEISKLLGDLEIEANKI